MSQLGGLLWQFVQALACLLLVAFVVGAGAGVSVALLATRHRAHPRRPGENEEFAARTMTAVRLAERGLDVSVPRAQRLVIAPERLN